MNFTPMGGPLVPVFTPKPCPFCASEAEVERSTWGVEGLLNCCYLKCKNRACQTRGPIVVSQMHEGWNEFLATERWNERAG